ncbi:hypothetical protein VaNZ11_010784 [Volvox africanus]|uniref:RWP-RK domain-containing protein n=1 Tax=Volvox africanus TaxID=51714 RepID=A0ABQ5SB86_9CHLO|nr:hypothetical protein VaNZ11_010784 [Volvox africanus]
METCMQPAGEINLQGITSAAVHGQRRSLGGTANSESCGIPPRHALMKNSRGPPVGRAGKHFGAESRERSYSDMDDLELATDNLDDSLSLSELQSVYHLPSKDAARSLNVSLSRLKRSCRTHNLLRWPHRKLSSLTNLQETITCDKNMKLFDKQRILQQIVNEIAAVRANPDHTIDPRLDEIRQAKYKLKYYHKTKHLHASFSAAARKRRHSSGCAERSHDFSHSFVCATSAPTATTATVTATYALVGVAPQQLSLSLPSTGPQPVGGDAPFAAGARPPVSSTSLHTSANAQDGTITTVAAVVHGDRSGGDSVEHRLALASPAPAPRFGSGGVYSHGGAFGLYSAGSAKCSVDGSGSGGCSVRKHSRNPDVLSTATFLTGRPMAVIPPLTAGRLSEPNAGTDRMAAPMWSFPSRQSGSPPSASSGEVNFVLQQRHEEQLLQQRQWQHLHQHELLRWEQQQVQLAAVRRHSVGIMDETSGAVHPLPGMASCGRQSATSLDGGTVPAADGGSAGRGRGAAVSHAGLHNTPWTLTPPTTQPAMAPPQTQNSFRTWVVHQAPASSPPAPASSGPAAGGGCGIGIGGGDPAMQSAGNFSGAGELASSNDTFLLGPEALHQSAVELQPPSGPISGFATFGGHALFGEIAGVHGGSNPAKPSMPYSHGVVNTSCPPPRCSSTGDPQVAAQLARQASAPHPSFTSTGCGGSGFSGDSSRCKGVAGERYGGSARALGALQDGVNRGRFHSVDGFELQKGSGLPPRQSQTGDQLSFQAAAAAAALGANAGASGGSNSGAGRSGGTMFRFEACMGISLSHGAMAPSWYAPEAPARIAGLVPEPTAAAAAPPSHGSHIPFAQKLEALLEPQPYQAQWPHERNEEHQQQQLLEYVRQQGHCSHTQPLPLNMAHALATQLDDQHPHPDMHQVQQQQHNVYFTSLSSGAGGGGAGTAANVESRPSPTPSMLEATFFSTPYAEYGGDGTPASAAARRSTLDKVSAANGYLAIEAVGGASAGLEPPQRRGGVVSAAVATGVEAGASYFTGAFATIPVATAAATGASFTAEVRSSNSSGAIATPEVAVGGQEKMRGMTMTGAGNIGTAGSEFLRSADGSNRISGMPTGVATLAASGLALPSAAAASAPGRAITTGVPCRLPSAAIRTPCGAAHYPFHGFADAMACVGGDWNSSGRGRGGGADGIPSRQEKERREVLGDIPPGQKPQPPPPQQQPKQQMQGQAQKQKEMQQQIPQFHFEKVVETCGGLFSLDHARVVTAPSGAAEANAFPGAGPAAAGAEAAAGRSGGGGVDMTGREQAESGELGSGAIGSSPTAALLVSLDWLLD